MRVAVIDIGSPKKDKKGKNNVGWAIVGRKSDCGTDLDKCVKSLARALEAGPLALGFEAPMFVPMREKPESLTEARCGESKAFSAGPGATALVTSTVVAPYVLRRLREDVPDATATLDWRDWPGDRAGPKQMLLFEAFGTNQNGSKDNRHVEDAKLAARELYSRLKKKRNKSDVKVDKCFSILGAMMLRTCWSSDIRILSESCLVVRPR